jgi:cell division protein FtsB
VAPPNIPAARSTASDASPSMNRRLRSLVWLTVGVVAVWFAIEGGEYGTLDLWRQHRQRTRLTREIDSLGRLVDSLRGHKQRVLNDPRTQERIAREEFGMVRGKELLYRFAEPDSQ